MVNLLALQIVRATGDVRSTSRKFLMDGRVHRLSFIQYGCWSFDHAPFRAQNQAGGYRNLDGSLDRLSFIPKI